MAIIVWVLFGLVAGFITSKLVNSRGTGVFLDITLGIVGAVSGGIVFNQLGLGAGGFNLWSLFVAVCGASVLLFVYHALASRDSV
jgi:uncharacterized membrane protein YeaQ/YmgE (transglycosylase-associated protein family)